MRLSNAAPMRTIVVTVLAVATTALATRAFATPVIKPVAAIVLQANAVTAGAVSLDQAVAAAEKQHNAKVVKTATTQEGGKTVYELRMLSEDGRVWSIRVDGATGAEL